MSRAQGKQRMCYLLWRPLPLSRSLPHKSCKYRCRRLPCTFLPRRQRRSRRLVCTRPHRGCRRSRRSRQSCTQWHTPHMHRRSTPHSLSSTCPLCTERMLRPTMRRRLQSTCPLGTIRTLSRCSPRSSSSTYRPHTPRTLRQTTRRRSSSTCPHHRPCTSKRTTRPSRPSTCRPRTRHTSCYPRWVCKILHRTRYNPCHRLPRQQRIQVLRRRQHHLDNALTPGTSHTMHHHRQRQNPGASSIPNSSSKSSRRLLHTRRRHMTCPLPVGSCIRMPRCRRTRSRPDKAHMGPSAATRTAPGHMAVRTPRGRR